jgi:CRISPR/Cas system Type II protein with McrA/HNH and RuvC-like nuclease domain
MAVTKKIRFEVFKRDGFRCAYCGKFPPAVILEVDHIDPKSRGGKDDINNLITSCFDCNRGKSNIPLIKAPPKLQENLEVLKEKEEQLKEYRKFIKKIEARIERDVSDIDNIYTEHFPEWSLSDRFKEITLKRFLNLLPKHIIIESLQYAMARVPNKDQSIKYFCGICWKKIKGTAYES